MSRWFRHYAGMMRDEKLVSVAIKSKQPVERVLWVWGAILESAAEIDENGKYELDPAEVAYFLRADQADIDAVLGALTDAGRLADGGVVKWGNRQFSSDKSNSRVAKYRERKRANESVCNGSQNEGNGDVTLQKHECNAPETETETDIPFSNENGAKVVDPAKVMFDGGISLITAAGKSEGQARAWLGKVRKTYGPEAVIVAIGAAKREGAIDPIPFMEASLRARERHGSREWEFTGPC